MLALTAISLTFDPTTFSFRIGDDKVLRLVYILKDVMYITSLRIDGKPVTGKDIQSQDDAIKTCEE